MAGPRLVNVVVLALLALFAVAMLVTALAKARLTGTRADRENERRPRAVAAESDPRRPDWFRTMDRDSDGRLSRKEFVGTAEQFKRLDTDGDRFISVAEAQVGDEWFRTQIPN